MDINHTPLIQDCQPLTLQPHLIHTLVLDMRHVPQHREDDEPCQEAGQTVYTTRHYGVPETNSQQDSVSSIGSYLAFGFEHTVAQC